MEPKFVEFQAIFVNENLSEFEENRITTEPIVIDINLICAWNAAQNDKDISNCTVIDIRGGTRFSINMNYKRFSDFMERNGFVITKVI